MFSHYSKKQYAIVLFAILLFGGWYWRYGGPWKLEPTHPSPKESWTVALARTYADDQDISIPKVAGGIKGPRSKVFDMPTLNAAYFGLPSMWTPIDNGSAPGQLFVNDNGIPLFADYRDGMFQYIPPPHTIDDNVKVPIRYEIIFDAFKCNDGTAVKKGLNVIYEDGTEIHYHPWGTASLWNIWVPVKPSTALSREMSFVCAVDLTTESTKHVTIHTPSELDVDRILGTWRVENDVKGRIAVGPIVISDKQLAWVADDNRQCVSDYELASRSKGSTYPGAAMETSNPSLDYTTFVLALNGVATKACGQKISTFTLSFQSNQRDSARFVAFFYVAAQGYGILRRVSSNEAMPINSH